MKNWQRNALLGFVSAVFFSLLYIVGILEPVEDRFYDFFLRFRADRELIDNVVFLDVDDPAIAYNGVFPWPRSIIADGLLRLKEYGAAGAILDIEYIDKGPQGVDSIYLNNGLPSDFIRSFSEINTVTGDVFSAIKAGRIQMSDIDLYAGDISALITDEQNLLFDKAKSVARDNDIYLGEASALFGKSWGTLNLRADPLSGEQAERRSLVEERFSLSIDAPSSIYPNENQDILPPIPVFAESLKGAGFTNVEIDTDGVRRRVYLAQSIHDHWYAQLAFAPLLDFLGNPAIELSRHSMKLKDAQLPSGTKDLTIPLDGSGRMMLSWPSTNYQETFQHISFQDFSLLEDYEAELEQLSRALLTSTDIYFFSEQDPSLAVIPFIVTELSDLYDASQSYRLLALENCSDESFEAYIDYRRGAREKIREILALNPQSKIHAIAEIYSREDPSFAAVVKDEADYIASLLDRLDDDLKRYDTLQNNIIETVGNRFCIIGRSDTGTTDIGVNPFFGEYVNVGTHAIVLNTILSESFILPLEIVWRILFALVGVTLFILATASLSPVLRAVAGFSCALMVLIASIALFRFTGIFIGPLGFMLSLVAAVIIREIVSYAGADREKRFYRKAFATYTSEAVADEIAKNPSLLQLGGTKRRMSALFTDIQGFSTISEQLSPEDLVSLLNRYLTVMSDLILNVEGTIDKYEGDAIVAFFGAPLKQDDHAIRACSSAIQLKKAELELNKLVMEQKLAPMPLLTRVGINSGDMVAGNMGTDKKMNYTIMGDAVNLAARLEGVNKQYRTWILASDNTIRETDGRFLVRRLDKVRVVGKSEPVQLYNVLNHIEESSAEEKKLVEVFHESLDYFENRNWKKARSGFLEVRSMESDGPAEIYLKRIEQYIEKEPDGKWDGVFNLINK
ncbi:MAG: adenylate/guanylate cyclase domain-containing protein [Treponema sp.]|jgi:adenylate cyclase|nr:adenylate/guanylate cyclase domain-containing protein [Treponema sp.]